MVAAGCCCLAFFEVVFYALGSGQFHQLRVHATDLYDGDEGFSPIFNDKSANVSFVGYCVTLLPVEPPPLLLNYWDPLFLTRGDKHGQQQLGVAPP